MLDDDDGSKTAQWIQRSHELPHEELRDRIEREIVEPSLTH
jgi:hypothetical protein